MTADMRDKICVVTGSTGGIGFVAARELARRGATVAIVGRSREQGPRAVAAVREGTGNERVEFFPCDLSRQQEIRRLAERLAARYDRVDVLLNNAGGFFGQRTLSADGIEMTFALNHLGYFLLTDRLLPMLREAAAARIVNVASEAHRGVSLPFDNLQGERRYHRWIAYKRSKLANLLFTYELARRLAGGRITVNALHPGFVATEIGTRHGGVPNILWFLGKLRAISPEEGARTSIYLASSPDVAEVTGQYFIRCKARGSSAASRDRSSAERLWAVSVDLTRARPSTDS